MRNNQKKDMKIKEVLKRSLKKIAIFLQIIMLFLPSIKVFANDINIGDTLAISRGNLGFYSVQYWNTNREKWMYITYSQTFYTAKDGTKKIAYCMDPDLDGVGYLPNEVESYDTTVVSKLDDPRIWRILKNGYPNVSKEDMNVETEDDAYFATKQAVYWIIRNRKLEEINYYMRAGQTDINGQDLDEIKRRGRKVLNAMYKLVDIAYNQTNQTMEKAQIEDFAEFKQDSVKKEYYSKTYRITNTSLNSKIIIDKLEGAPEGTYIANQNGEAKTTFNGGDYIKVMIPKKNIIENCNVKISYQMISDSFPVYRANSKEENKQNYMILTDEKEIDNGILQFNINGKTSKLKVKKVDEISKKAMPNITFELKYENGEKIGNFTTDKNGEINLDNLSQGRIIISEVKTDDDHILSKSPFEISLNYKAESSLTIENSRKNGSLIIKKVDSESNEAISDVEFDIINENNEKIATLKTDEKGEAKIVDIPIGMYTVKETKPREEYKNIEDKEIKITSNETLELKIENTKKKGRVQVEKMDYEDTNIKLANVKFNLLDAKGNILEKLETDSFGQAISKEYPIGTYYIQEIETDKSHILLDKKIEVKIEEDKIANVEVKNERIKGNIKLIKTSSDYNKILNKEAGSAIEGVKFNIFDRDNKFIEQIITDKNGEAITSKLDKGTYHIQEVETAKWYILNNEKITAEIKENNEIITVNITNKAEKPDVEITKKCRNTVSSNEEIDFEFTIKNTGNTDLTDFTWYDILPTDFARITKISTGTYNQDVRYSIYYKTNQKDDYMVIEKNIDGRSNNYIDVSNIHLDEDEKITEVKIVFGDVKKDFSSIEKPHIIMMVNDGVQDDTEIKNHTILEAYNKEYKACNEDDAISIVYNIKKEKKLPRTGY